MATKNHSEVVKGSRHAPYNLEYSNRSNREAGTSEASGIVLAAANVHQVARQTDDDSYWILLNHSPITWSRIIHGPAADDQTLTVNEGSCYTIHSAPVTMAIDDTFTLATSSAGWGIFAGFDTSAGSNNYSGIVSWNGNGQANIIASTGVFATTDTANRVCFIDSGSFVTVKNRITTSIILLFDVHYYAY